MSQPGDSARALRLLALLFCGVAACSPGGGEVTAAPPTVPATVPASTIQHTVPPAEPVPGAPDEETVAKARRSTVRISGLGCIASQVGSGFVVRPGLVVTAAHVVAGLEVVDLELGGSQGEARVVAFDPVSDLAILATEADLPAGLPLGRAHAGQELALLAYSEEGEEETRLVSVIRPIRAVGKDIYGEPGDGRDALELEAGVMSGNSGAPLLDGEGSVVGVLFSRTRGGQPVAYAVQSGEVSELLVTLEDTGSDAPSVDPGECRPR